MQWGSWHGAHCFNRMLRDRASVTTSGSQLHKYLSHGCCHRCLLQKWGHFLSRSLLLSSGLWSAQLTWNKRKSKANEIVRPRQMDRPIGHLFNNQANLSGTPHMWLTFVIVFSAPKCPSYLGRVSACWRLGDGQGPWLNQGEEQIPFLTPCLLGQ